MSELELWNELGNIYFKTGAVNEAIRTYQKVIELDPGCCQPYSHLASIFVGQGRFAEAIPILQKGIELMGEATNQAFLWNQLGDAYRKLEDYANACSSFRKAIELDPQDALYKKNLAEVEPASRIVASETMTGINQDNLPSAGPEIEGTGNSEPGNACWVFKGNEPALPVEENSSAATKLSPIILGSRTLDLGNRTLSIDPPKAVESIDASVYGLLRLGILHWRSGEYERAIQFLKIALDKAERSQNPFQGALSYYAIARVETDLGKIEDAIQAYQSAANLAPELISPWNNLGDLNCMLNRYEDARAAFQEAIEHNPKDPVSWNGLGDVYQKLGRSEDAIAAYQLGNVFEKQSIEEDALKEFEKALDSEQGNPLVWNEAGFIYFDTGAYSDAISSFRKAIELDPANATYQASLAKAEQALEEVNTRSEPRLQETVTKIDPETLPHSEPFVPETISQAAEETTMAQSGSNTTGHAQEAEALSEKRSLPAKEANYPEPKTAFWMFESVSPHGNAQQPVGQYLPVVAETVMKTAKPNPAYTLQTDNAQAFLCDLVRKDTIRDHANILVQLAPRVVKPARTGETINSPVAKYDLESASVEVDLGLRKPACVSAEIKTGDSAPHAIATGDQPSDQPSQDPQVFENDIAAYRKVTEINPKNDRAWDTLGNKYETVGLHSQAVAAFKQAITLAPQKEVYHYHLGIALAYQMQYDQAIQAFQKVVALNPRYMLAHCALAGSYRRLGMEAEAQKHMEIARPSMEEENEYNQACFESIGGNADRAFTLLECALQKQQVQPGMVLSDPDLDFIRNDPRFEALLTKNGIFR